MPGHDIRARGEVEVSTEAMAAARLRPFLLESDNGQSLQHTCKPPLFYLIHQRQKDIDKYISFKSLIKEKHVLRETRAEKVEINCSDVDAKTKKQ